MKYYKLLSQVLTSYSNTQWELDKTITVSVPGNAMCTNQVLHCYNHPLLAVILNPAHADIKNPRLFEISVDEIVSNDGLKFASKSQTLIKELELPKISLEQKVEFGIRVAKLVCKDEKWNEWADNWLNGSDKSKESAYSANTINIAYVANAATYATYVADAVLAATYVADAAAWVVDWAVDKNEFNQKMINIIEEIVKVRE